MSSLKGGSEVKAPDPEDYNENVANQSFWNRINQETPFGGTKYTTPDALSFEDWKTQNPMEGFYSGYDNPLANTYSSQSTGGTGRTWNAPDYAGGYADYKAGLPQQVESYFSPELQGIFDKQFDPNAYDMYSDDYMGRYNELIAPGRERQLDRFQQSMFDRGMPEGGDIYGDIYRETIGDPNARQDVMAADAGQRFAEQANLTDFNKLMAAMGQNTIQYPQVDTMGPAGMEFQSDIYSLNNKREDYAKFWEELSNGIQSYFTGGMGG